MRWLSRLGTQLGVFVLWLMHFLPNRAVAVIGSGLGAILYRFGRGRVTDINLKLCFPHMPEAERLALGQEHFRRLGRSLAEMSILWWGSDERVLNLVRTTGLEHLEAARQDNPKQPIILLAPHFIGLNLGGAKLAHYLGPSSSIYSRQKNPVVDRLLLMGRLRFGQPELMSRQDGLKPVIRAIRAGKPFYFLPDMDFGPRDSIFVPFFGVQTATVTALPRLAKLTGAKVIPIITRQHERDYELHIYPAWENFPTDDLEADVRRMNLFIEDRAREILPQYFWAHKRFKTRPLGEKNPYRKPS